jgi:serine phosphatase RsbU (regulator of sigma subunit)
VDSAEILLVEDDAGDALLVEELLSDAAPSFKPVWVASIAEAERRVTASTLCILLDLGLPDSEGLEGLRHTLLIAGRIPVIVLTGRVDRDLGEAAVAVGAQDYLVKGTVSGEELVRAVRYAVERRKGQETAQRLAEAEIMAAEKARLERGLLPRPIIANDQLTWATHYRPGGGRALLGGDFFDGIERADGSLRVLMGDVTGHGPDEAALGVALRVAWRSLVLAGTPTDSVLGDMQLVLTAERHAEDVFATVLDVTVAPDLTRAEFRLAGHPAPLIVGRGRVEQADIHTRGPLLGLVEDATWPTAEVELGTDWAVVLFTDGVIEGRDPAGGRLDVAGLVGLAAQAVGSGCSLRGLGDELLAGAEKSNGGPLSDDVALFLIGTGDRW